CHNDLSYYQTQAGIDLIAKAKYLLQEKDYRLWTYGRRILAYHSDIIEERDEESMRLLKKIVDIEIEYFPSHILEKIKSTWKNWNSLRLSFDSLNLDEIEEINLDNIQQG
ncbi:hypothetical protein Godav_024464, partial [Gossypium davidsonii]|nr:hypothetical protein [Gossypium davidsonii]